MRKQAEDFQEMPAVEARFQDVTVRSRMLEKRSTSIVGGESAKLAPRLNVA